MTTTMERQVTEKDMIDSELVSWVDNLYKKSDKTHLRYLGKLPAQRCSRTFAKTNSTPTARTRSSDAYLCPKVILAFRSNIRYNNTCKQHAGLAQLLERFLAMEEARSQSLLTRTNETVSVYPGLFHWWRFTPKLEPISSEARKLSPDACASKAGTRPARKTF